MGSINVNKMGVHHTEVPYHVQYAPCLNLGANIDLHAGTNCTIGMRKVHFLPEQAEEKAKEYQ